MQRPSTAETVYKLALAGEHAGFSLEDTIRILNSGVRRFARDHDEWSNDVCLGAKKDRGGLKGTVGETMDTCSLNETCP